MNQQSQPTVLITGSAGLIGSEVCQAFDQRGFPVHGLDNNQRREFFGPDGDTSWNQKRLATTLKSYVHHAIDIRDRAGVLGLIRTLRPGCIVHAAAQPAVEHQPHADAGADMHEGEALLVAPVAVGPLGQRRRVHVVLQRHRWAERLAQADGRMWSELTLSEQDGYYNAAKEAP